MMGLRAIRISPDSPRIDRSGAGGRSHYPLPSQPRPGRLTENLTHACRCGLVDRLLPELLHNRDYAQTVRVLANAIDQTQKADALAQSPRLRAFGPVSAVAAAPTIPTYEPPSL
jgi:hypothetical protein